MQMTTPASLEALKEKIEALDLGPIKYKLVCEYGWTRKEADAMEPQYKAFLYLSQKYPDKSIVPSKRLDEMWHMHILDTRKYAEDCEHLFGHFLHHFPYFGLRGADDAIALANAFQETAEIFKKEFGIDLSIDAKTEAADCTSGTCGTSCGAQCSDYVRSEARPVY